MQLKICCILILGIFTSLVAYADSDDKTKKQNHNIEVKALNSPVKQKFAEFSLELPVGFLPGRAEYEIESVENKSKKRKFENNITLENQSGQNWLAKVPVDSLEPGNFKIEFEVKAAKSWIQTIKYFIKGVAKDNDHPNRGEYKGKTIFVVADTLEVPDPGEAGLLTLAGIDSDNDGVRDDVQRWILINHGDSEKTVAALKQVARTQQVDLLTAFLDRTKSIEAGYQLFRALDCLEYIKGLDRTIELRKQMDSQIINTDARIRADIRANANFSGQTVGSRPLQKADCDFDPDALPN